jgi:hypothetical protein
MRLKDYINNVIVRRQNEWDSGGGYLTDAVAHHD